MESYQSIHACHKVHSQSLLHVLSFEGLQYRHILKASWVDEECAGLSPQFCPRVLWRLPLYWALPKTEGRQMNQFVISALLRPAWWEMQIAEKSIFAECNWIGRGYLAGPTLFTYQPVVQYRPGKTLVPKAKCDCMDKELFPRLPPSLALLQFYLEAF